MVLRCSPGWSPRVMSSGGGACGSLHPRAPGPSQTAGGGQGGCFRAERSCGLLWPAEILAWPFGGTRTRGQLLGTVWPSTRPGSVLTSWGWRGAEQEARCSAQRTLLTSRGAGIPGVCEESLRPLAAAHGLCLGTRVCPVSLCGPASQRQRSQSPARLASPARGAGQGAPVSEEARAAAGRHEGASVARPAQSVLG